MAILNNSILTFTADSEFEWELNGFDCDTLYKTLVIQKQAVPLAGKAPVQAKTNMGFGLKKKSVEVVSEISTNQQLVFDLETQALDAELLKQFKQAHKERLIQQPIVFVLGLGSVTLQKRKRPVFCVPVHLVNDPSQELPFLIQWSEHLPFFHDEVSSALIEHDILLPVIPDVLSDISLKNIFHDITYKTGAELGFQIVETVTIYKVHQVFKKAESLQKLEIPKDDLQAYDTSFTHTRIMHSAALKAAYQLSKSPLTATCSLSNDDLIPALHSLSTHFSLEKPVVLSSERMGLLRKMNRELQDISAVLPLYEWHDPEHFVDGMIQFLEQTISIDSVPEPNFIADEIIQNIHDYSSALISRKEDDLGSPAEIMHYLMKTGVKSTYQPEAYEISGLSSGVLNQRKQVIKQILKFQYSLQSHPVWDKVNPSLPHDELVEELQKASQKMIQIHHHIDEYRGKAHDLLGLTLPEDIAKLDSFIHKLSFIEQIPQFERHQLDQNWHPIPEIIPKAFAQIHKVKKEIEKLKPYFHVEIINEPLEQLIPELEAKSHSLKRFIDWNFRQHAKRLLAYARASNQKFDQSYIAHLRDVVKVQKEISLLNDYGNQVAKYFGSYWQGLETDEKFLRKQMAWFEAFSKLKLEHINDNIDQLKRLILRKDTARAVATIKDLRHYLIEAKQVEKHLAEIMGITLYDLRQLLDAPGLNIKAFFEDLIEHSGCLKQKAMLHRLKESDQAKRVQRFIDHALELNLNADEAAERYEHAIRIAYLQKLEDERSILKHLEISDIRKILDMIQEQYKQLCEWGIFKKVNQFNQLRNQASIKKKIKELIHQLKQLKESPRIPHTQALLHLSKEMIQHLQPVILADPLQLDLLSRWFDAHVITTFESAVPTGFSNSWIVMLGKGHVRPAVLSVTELSKDDFTKGDIATERIIAEFQRAEEQEIAWIFESEKAEQTFWHKVTHSAVDFNSWTKSLNAGLIQCITVKESDLEQSTLPYFDGVIVDYSYIDPKTNPFALKKSNPNKLIDTAKRIAELGHSITVCLPPPPVSDDNKKKVSALQEELAWKPTPGSILAKQIEKATFLEEHPIKGESTTEMQGFIRCSDGRIGRIWSDTDSTLFEAFHDSLCEDGSIYNPVRKVFKKADSLLLDCLNFIKNEPVAKQNEKKNDVIQTQEDHPIQTVSIQTSKAVEEKLFTTTVPMKDPFLPPDIPTEFTFKKINKPSKAVKPKLNRLPRIKPYVPYEGLTVGEPDQFFTASARSLKKVILEIVQTESPIHWHRLTRLLVAAWQIERLNENALTITKRLLTELAEQAEISVKDGVVYDNPDFKFTIRSRSEIQDFNAEEIPLVELEMALFLVLDQYHPLEMDDLIKAAAYLLGFKELSQPMETVLKRALIKMGVEDVVCVSEGGFQLTRPILL